MKRLATAVAALCLLSGPVWARDPGYVAYRHQVDKATHRVYLANRGVIDPHRLRGRGYDLDHKVPVKVCYQRGMSVASCSAVGNLRMLSAHENRSEGCREAGCRRR